MLKNLLHTYCMQSHPYKNIYCVIFPQHIHACYFNTSTFLEWRSPDKYQLKKWVLLSNNQSFCKNNGREIKINKKHLKWQMFHFGTSSLTWHKYELLDINCALVTIEQIWPISQHVLYLRSHSASHYDKAENNMFSFFCQRLSGADNSI